MSGFIGLRERDYERCAPPSIMAWLRATTVRRSGCNQVRGCSNGALVVVTLDHGGERSSAGRASVCGTEGRGFKPRRSPQFPFFRQPSPTIAMSMAFQAVRKVALSLDGVEEGTSYGTAAFRVKGELFARQHQDMESLVLRTDFEQRAELMAADPETYYITDHYLKYEWVLVRMARLHPDALRDLLRMACRFATANKRGMAGRKRKGR